ncbi:17381_t:CDS:10 [Funneliformis geosporum]|uniref:17381_t:CDS:1 n=1 Tax=Funneliformis geosporum TaxID=1117311 RepID=A0A9W4WV32_9GLOM|nr:17381_t:CDS:10 [Funneliformis geosporum]
MRGAKTERNRREYWERSKKLLNGSLITSLLPNQYAKQQTNDNTSGSIFINCTKMYSPYFGVMISRNEKALVKNPTYADIDTDISIFPIALNEMSNSHLVEFDLSVICKDKNQDLELKCCRYRQIANKINERCKLDLTQAEALISALTREISLIEGPPGTRKTVINNENIVEFARCKYNEYRLGSRIKSDKIKEFCLEDSDLPSWISILKKVLQVILKKPKILHIFDRWSKREDIEIIRRTQKALSNPPQKNKKIKDPRIHMIKEELSSLQKSHDDKRQKMSIGPRIIVCEETGEVLKAHILSAFTLQLRRTLYPKLIDGENTGKYPNIRDAQYNVYFINHRHPEDSGGDLAMQSHVNKYEVEMVVETRRTKLEEIERRVDGTNNRNEKANSSENKECISLVNFELMASESKDMWATVIKILDEQNQIGDVSPDGGCYENCTKLHPCAHPCPKLCFEDCGKCECSVRDIILPKCGYVLQLMYCDHSKVVHCFESIDNASCNEYCGNMLECNHECLTECNRFQNFQNHKKKHKTNQMKKQIKSPETPWRMRITKETNEETNKRSNHGKYICLWECEHQGRCELSCGAPYQIPCNERCNKQSKCEHICAGVFSFIIQEVSKLLNVTNQEHEAAESTHYSLLANVEILEFDLTIILLNNFLKSCNDVKTCDENLGKPLSDEETLEIHRAMKTESKRTGNWFECPNGHPVNNNYLTYIYTIGEHSGAMEA